jgi:hypothetical protein
VVGDVTSEGRALGDTLGAQLELLVGVEIGLKLDVLTASCLVRSGDGFDP